MSKRKGSPEERRRKAALFKGKFEKTMAPSCEIVLSAKRRGRNAYKVSLTTYDLRVPQKPVECRTLAEADAVVAELVRQACIRAAKRAFNLPTT